MGPDKTETRSEGWAPAMRGLRQNVIPQANQMFQSGQSFLAPQSQYTNQANSMVAQMAGRPIGPSAEFNSALDTQAERMGTDVSRQFGMLGRGGSVAHQNALVDRVGGLRMGMTADEIARQEGLQARNVGLLGAVGAQQDARAQMDSPWGRLGQYGGLMSGLSGLGGTNTQTQSGGLGVFGDVAGLGLSALNMASGMPAIGGIGRLFRGAPQATGAPVDIRPNWYIA